MTLNFIGISRDIAKFGGNKRFAKQTNEDRPLMLILLCVTPTGWSTIRIQLAKMRLSTCTKITGKPATVTIHHSSHIVDFAVDFFEFDGGNRGLRARSADARLPVR